MHDGHRIAAECRVQGNRAQGNRARRENATASLARCAGAVP